MKTDMGYWKKELDGILPGITAVRRALHRRPELSGQETETRKRVIHELQSLGIQTQEFQDCNAVMGILRNGDGRCVAIRADMDALPVTEETGLEFSSENHGVMHACGHDVHMALALGSATWLSQHREKWHGTVKWLFEPMEETLGGGKWMVEQGCLDNPKVDCVLGQHVNPRYPAGTFFCKSGYVSGASDEVHLTVQGSSCHGAYPESGIDAIVITAQVISALQTLVSRSISPFDPAVITIGTIEGGKANNIVCGEVKMTGTLRTLSEDTRMKLRERIERTACGVAESLGGKAIVQIRPSYGAVYNDDHYYTLVEEQARRILGEEHVVLRAAPSLGVESFCYFLKDTPGVYYDIGSGISTALHTPTFVVDEAVLLPGIAMQCACALAVLSETDS